MDDVESKEVGSYDDRILSLVDDLMVEANLVSLQISKARLQDNAEK